MNLQKALLQFWVFFCLLMMAGFVYQSIVGWNMDGNLYSVLPDVPGDEDFLEANKKYEDRVSGYTVFLIQGKKWGKVSAATRRFAGQLKNSSLFEQVRYQVSEGEQKKIASFYFPYRHQLLSQPQIKKIQNKETKSLRENTIMQIYSPFGSSAVATLETDPFGLFTDFLSGLQGELEVSIKDGLMTVLTGSGKPASLIFAQVGEGWLNMSQQKKIDDFTNESIRLLNKEYSVKTFRTGVLYYMAHGVKSATSEITTVGLGSLIGIIVLLIFIFRGFQPLIVSFFLVGLSAATASLVTHFIFGSLQIFCVLMGSSLLGLVIDYSCHFFAQKFHPHLNTGQEARAHIFKPLLLSLLTSCVGYSLLFFAGLPGLNQLAVFTLVGLLTAFMSVIYLYPLLSFKNTKGRPSFVFLRGMESLWGQAAPKKLGVLMALLFLLSLGLLLSLQFRDDVRLLQPLSKDLKKQEKVIRSLTQGDRAHFYILNKADSVEELLVLEEELSLRLLEADIELKPRSFSQWVPSRHQQEKSLASYGLLKPEIEKLYNQLKIPKGKQKKWLENRSLKLSPLEVSSWLNQWKTYPVSMQWLGKVSKKYFSVTMLGGKADFIDLDSFLPSGSKIVKKVESLTAVLKKVREKIVLIFVGSVCIAFIIFFFLFDGVKAFRIVYPPLISASLAIGFSGLLLGFVNLFNVLAMMLVFFLGVDYSLFFSYQYYSKSQSTLIAVFLSFLTTVLSFGLLSFSETGAVAAFGLTILIGMTLNFILSPYSIRNQLC